VIVFVSKQTNDKFVDADGSGSQTVGDYDIFTETLLDEQSHQPVGIDNARCTLDFNGEMCEGLFTLTGRGDLSIQTQITNVVDLAITGGTGEFAGASGEAIGRPLQGGNTEWTVFIS